MATDWAEESTAAEAAKAAETSKAAEIPKEPAESKEAAAPAEPQSDLASAQGDGTFNAPGGDFIQDPEWDVEVKLKDLQADPDNPLYSIKSFNDLQL